jgi:hypothetical protein
MDELERPSPVRPPWILADESARGERGESENVTYKGMDLNLRSGRAWPGREPGIDDTSANGGGWSHPTRGAPEPILVDDQVEACCNSAFDAAQFHGAAEVRVEHLLHAMTRVRAAAELLEQLGIHSGQVRQETAVAIASVAPSNAEGGAPRTSKEMEEILRRAAAFAGERKVSATVADLLRAVLSLGRKAPTTMLLMRAAPDPAALERWRDEPRRDASQGLLADPSARAGARPNLADALFKRLDSMEATLRALQMEIASERKAVAEALAQREDALPTAGIEQVQAVASELESRISEAMTSFGDRLSAIDKLPAMENLAYMGARLDLIEKQLAGQSKEVAEAVSNTLLEHLIKTEEGKATPSALAGPDRLAALEATIEGHLQRSDEASKTHEHSLAEIYEALVKLGTNQQTLASNLNTWRVENSGDISIISNRLQEMERNAQDTLSRLGGQMQPVNHVARGEDRPFGSFKRWLYGTTSVLSGAWRDNPDAVRKRLAPATEPLDDRVEDASVVTFRPAADAPVEEKKV